ncbi:hypothetical protein [Vibrio sinaloensis]|uniref:Uncharacterized protein n=1 Tax=Photobacterium sp. (strain ATCC 43367) TaxID=379097 RepID=A0A0A5JKJ4_PHOS4|nr:hypothetical protein [Vibrio sinaloensis]KGY08443.1 hypothetical protein NM06_11935 [Vibrio sinaloensis]
MNSKVVQILIVVLVIPLLIPHIMNLYVSFFSENNYGTRGEWLSFLGGYSGGFLAFISAWLLYSLERDEKRQTYIYVSSEITTTSNLAPMSIVFTNKNDIEFDVKRQSVVSTEDYEAIRISFKNVSDNFAKKVTFRLNNTDPWVHRGQESTLHKYKCLTDLESKQTFTVNLHIDPIWLSSTLDFEIESTNLFNQVTKQKVRLHRGLGWSFEQLT